MGKIKYLMDTGGYCFVCLKSAKIIELANGGGNGGAPEATTPKEGGGDELEYNDPRTYSFRNMCEYLKINLQEVCREAVPITGDVGGRSLSILKEAEVRGALCSGCGPLFECFSKAFGELEGIKMKLGHYLKSIHERMVEADKCHGEFADLMLFEEEVVRRHETALRNQLVEQLRRKTMAKCSTMLGRGRHPVVVIGKKKLTPVQKATMPLAPTPTTVEAVTLYYPPNPVIGEQQSDGIIQLQLPPNTDVGVPQVDAVQHEIPPDLDFPVGTVQFHVPPDVEHNTEGTVQIQLPPDMRFSPGETVQIHLPPNVRVSPGETFQLEFLNDLPETNEMLNDDETLQTFSIQEASSVEASAEGDPLAEVTSNVPVVDNGEVSVAEPTNTSAVGECASVGKVVGAVAEPTSKIPVVGKFKCGMCPSSTVEFRSYKMFELHYRRAHLEPPKPKKTEFKCDLCDKVFSKSYSLTHHKRTVHHGGRFQCKFCPKTFRISDDRRRHMQLKCAARFPNMTKLRGRKKRNLEVIRSHESFMALVEEASIAIPVPTSVPTAEPGTTASGSWVNMPSLSPTIATMDGEVLITNNNNESVNVSMDPLEISSWTPVSEETQASAVTTSQIEIHGTGLAPPTFEEDLVQQQQIEKDAGTPSTTDHGSSSLGKLKCDLCSSSGFENDEALQLHLNSDHVHQDGRFKCEFCYKSFTRKSALKRHTDLHCTMKFRHMNRKDVSNVSPKNNPEAATATTNSESATVPLVPDPVLANSYECYVCSKLYPLISPEDHERVHHHGQKLLCHGCHQRFLENSDNLRHKGPRGPRKRRIRLETTGLQQHIKSKQKRVVEASQLLALNPENDVHPGQPEPTVETGNSAIPISLPSNSSEGSSRNDPPNVTSPRSHGKSPLKKSSPSKMSAVEVVESQDLPSPDVLDEEVLDDEVENGEKSEGHSSKFRPPKANFKCDSCDKTFNRRSNYTKHQQLFHFGGGAERIQCEYCDKSFHHLRLWTRHMMEHAGESEATSAADDKTSDSRDTAVTNEVPLAVNSLSESGGAIATNHAPAPDDLSSSTCATEAADTPDATPTKSTMVAEVKRVSSAKRSKGNKIDVPNVDPTSNDDPSSPVSVAETNDTPVSSDNTARPKGASVTKAAPSSIMKRSSFGRAIVPKSAYLTANGGRITVRKTESPLGVIPSSTHKVSVANDRQRPARPSINRNSSSRPSTSGRLAVRKSAPGVISSSSHTEPVATARRRAGRPSTNRARSSMTSIAQEVAPSEEITASDSSLISVSEAKDTSQSYVKHKLATPKQVSKAALLSAAKSSNSGKRSVRKAAAPTPPAITLSGSKRIKIKKAISTVPDAVRASTPSQDESLDTVSQSTIKDATPSSSRRSTSKVAPVKTKKLQTKVVESASHDTPPPPAGKYKFCVCKIFMEREKMVRCENKACSFGSWFHYSNDPPCVKYDNEEEWYCVMCKPSMLMRKSLKQTK